MWPPVILFCMLARLFTRNFFLIKGRVSNTSLKLVSCLKMCKGKAKVWFHFHSEKACISNLWKKFQPCMKLFTQTLIRSFLFLIYACITSSRFFNDRRIPYDCFHNVFCKTCFLLSYDSSSNSTNRDTRKS